MLGFTPLLRGMILFGKMTYCPNFLDCLFHWPSLLSQSLTMILSKQAWVMTVAMAVVAGSSCLAFVPHPSVSPTPKTNSSVLLASTLSYMLPEGIVKTITTPGNENRRANLGDIATVKYSCYVPEKNEKPFAKAMRQKVVGSMDT
jgi:hypothetical protein